MSPPSSTVLSAGIGHFSPARLRPFRKLRVPSFMVVGAAWAADIIMLTAAGLIACAAPHWSRQDWPWHTAATGNDLLLALVGAWGGMTVLQRLKAYRMSVLCAPAAQARRAVAAALVGGACFAAAASLQNRTETAFLAMIAAWGFAAVGLLSSERLLASMLIRRWCADGRVARRVAVVGSSAECEAFLARLDKAPNRAIDIVGVYDSHDAQAAVADGAQPGLRSLAELVSDSRHADLDAVVIAVADANADRIDTIRSTLDGLAVDIFVAAAPHMAACRNIVRLGNVPAGLIAGRPLSDWQAMQKTLFDRCAALLLLALASPVLIAIGIAVRLESAGPSLFRQSRTGFNNMPFMCFKFRTMYQHLGDAVQVQQAVRGDRRVTRIGAWLRRTSLDELPQLINVLRGEMSLVGPRPHAPNTRAAGLLFDEIVTNYGSRHRVKPGITGWAQVNGWRGETPTVESVQERVRHDLFYVHNWSMLFDLRILLRTGLLMLKHDTQAY